MEKRKTKPQQRAGKYYSVKQKREMIEAYLESGKSKQQVWREFTGEAEEKGQLIRFMRQLGYLESSAKKKPITFYMEEKTASKPVMLPLKDGKDAEIDKLRQDLEDCRLREHYYLTMIEMAEKELRINIRKKSCTK